jgi:microcystin-dependent protein
MVPIKLAQYADKEGTLHFVQYKDETHLFVDISDDTAESSQLRNWIRTGNTVDEYAPIISGGIVPVATIMWFCSQRPPEGYLLCDGSAVGRVQYSQLFRAVGETYGSGNGVSTFNLPSLVGRFCRGWGEGDPLDPNRQFGSYQDDAPGIHTHLVPSFTHTHTINDPGHIHGVTDPGHVHGMTDPGHNHTVTDPGHQMFITTPLTHQGWILAYSNLNPGVIRMDNPSGWWKISNYVLSTEIANLEVLPSTANVRLSKAQSNVTTNNAVTGISINTAQTNIPFTDNAGEGETRPDNVALLPVIRY